MRKCHPFLLIFVMDMIKTRAASGITCGPKDPVKHKGDIEGFAAVKHDFPSGSPHPQLNICV